MKYLIVKTILIFSSLLIAHNSFSFSQEAELSEVIIPQLNKTGASIQDFVPSGWGIELSESGDLGGDGSQVDYLLLLKMQDENNVLNNNNGCKLDTNPRMLVFLLARDGGYFLAGQNSTLIPRQDRFCDSNDSIDGVTGGDITIKRKEGIVELGFFSGSLGHKSFVFRWFERNQRVYLTACNYYSRHRASGETSTIEADYLKRQVRYEVMELHENEEEDSYEEVITRDEVLPLFPRRLIRLEDMGVFHDFDCANMSSSYK